MRDPVSVLGGRGPRRGLVRRVQRVPLRRRDIRGVDVSGLSLVKVVRIPGNVLAPNSWRQVIFVDDRASKEQAEALVEAYQGDLGGPLADLAGLVGETLAIERATIVHEVGDGEGTLRVGDFVSSQLGPYRGPDGSVTTLRDSLFSTVPGRRHGWARPRRTPSTCPSTGWCGPSRTATRSRPTTGCRTRRSWPDVDDTSDGPPDLPLPFPWRSRGHGPSP